MFDKKYTDTMKMLESEIQLTHEIFLDSLAVAKTTNDESVRKEVTRFANECLCRYKALKGLKTKFIEEVGA